MVGPITNVIGRVSVAVNGIITNSDFRWGGGVKVTRIANCLANLVTTGAILAQGLLIRIYSPPLRSLPPGELISPRQITLPYFPRGPKGFILGLAS